MIRTWCSWLLGWVDENHFLHKKANIYRWLLDQTSFVNFSTLSQIVTWIQWSSISSFSWILWSGFVFLTSMVSCLVVVFSLYVVGKQHAWPQAVRIIWNINIICFRNKYMQFVLILYILIASIRTLLAKIEKE